MLTCQICGFTHPSMIHFSHIRGHGLTTEEYKSQFPGHPLRIQSEESKAKVSQSKKGAQSPFKGVKRGPNTKLSETIAGKPRPQLRGLKRTDEQKQRISEKTKEAMIDKMTPEVKAKMKDAIAKRKDDGTYVPPMLGKTMSEESKNKIRASLAETTKAKSAQAIFQLIAQAAEDNLAVVNIENNYWFTFQCNICSSTFTFSKQVFRNSTKGGRHLCPTCYPRLSGSSQMEKDLCEFVKSIYPGQVIANDRVALGGKEIDIYCPDKKIGFEFTGLYWHAKKQNDEDRHLLWKTQFAAKEGITLITIFEDEWTQKPDIVKSRIRGLLGLHLTKIYARKCEVKIISSKEKNEFLVQNHLQGKDTASISLGLFHNSELVSVATFKKTNMAKGGDGTSWELSRFCSKLNHRIVGGAGKLVSHFMTAFNDGRPLISYADRRWSNGDLYQSLGFQFSGSTQPSYWFTADYKTRVHRSAMMKHRLVECEADHQFTGWELAQRRGFDKIYDCGTTKWILNT
jgi:very-short-patch-repair endonuclease